MMSTVEKEHLRNAGPVGIRRIIWCTLTFYCPFPSRRTCENSNAPSALLCDSEDSFVVFDPKTANLITMPELPNRNCPDTRFFHRFSVRWKDREGEVCGLCEAETASSCTDDLLSFQISFCNSLFNIASRFPYLL